jgi:seryl-tRNA synthetase
MTQAFAATSDAPAFRAELLRRGLLVESGAPGVYGRSAGFEDVRLRFDDLVTREALPEAAERLRFPPIMQRGHFESAGFLKSFPHLAGSVFAFEGTEMQAAQQQESASRHEDWSEFQSMTDLVLVPAACYPAYPVIAARGPLPPGGVTLDLGATYVFRHEPSADPARMQAFHQRELVRIGEPQTVGNWRQAVQERALGLLARLGLEVSSEVASDPFFGRAGRMLAASQRDQELKFELVAPIAGDEPTAVASFNYHQDHFATTFGIELGDGGTVHTACVGFGEERVVLALFAAHGLDVDRWPSAVRRELWGE